MSDDVRIQKNIDLSRMHTLHGQAAASFFCKAKTQEDFAAAVNFAKKNNLGILVLGGGSNIAFVNNTVDKLVIKNDYKKKEIVKDEKDYVEILVSSGYPVGQLINETVDAGYAGFEYHLGLPGTVGGALYMNSKWTKPQTYFGDNLICASLIDKNGSVKTVDRKYFQFGYDFSIIQKTGEILLDAVFRLKKTENPIVLKKKSREALEYRKKTQPIGDATSGCFYQNLTKKDAGKLGFIQTESAGNLIDRAGLKGFQVGDFIVSSKHANFIINEGVGKPEDLKKLLEIISKKIKEKYNIRLKEEVRLV